MQALSGLHAWASQPIVYMPLIGAALLALLILRKPATAIYVGLIPLINWSFAHVPVYPMPDGGVYQPFALVTGLVLVARDFCQREIGHRVFLAMAAGLLFSAMTTPLAIVAASGIAFAISELADWAVYTFTKRPLSQRILYSSLLGAPIDSAVFLYGANFVTPGVFAWSTLLSSVASKIFGAFVVSRIVASRERKADAGSEAPAA